MLAAVGFATVLIVLILILTKKSSPLVALIAVPTIACLVVGQGAQFGEYVVSGIKSISPTIAMFAFALVFFNYLIDIGTFEPIVQAALRFAKNSPAKIMIATIIISIVGHLDGAGSTTFILTVGAMLPIFKKLHLSPMYLIILCGMSAGIMNILPWGGPTMRVMTVFEAGASEVFAPLLIPMVVGLVSVCALGIYFGKMEQKRLAAAGIVMGEMDEAQQVAKAKNELGVRLYLNWILIIVAMTVMIAGYLDAAPTMMLACTAAFLINCRKKEDQDEIIAKFAPVVFNVVLVGLSTAIFTGVLSNAGFLDAMANAIVSIIPQSLGRYFTIVVGVLAFPMSFLFTPDAYYYSILPTLSTAASAFGVSALEVGQASLLGQMTVGFPFSGLNATSYMLPDMVGISFGDFQKKGIPYAYAVSLIMVLSAVICGII